VPRISRRLDHDTAKQLLGDIRIKRLEGIGDARGKEGEISMIDLWWETGRG
jgi:hypothetical protein